MPVYVGVNGESKLVTEAYIGNKYNQAVPIYLKNIIPKGFSPVEYIYSVSDLGDGFIDTGVIPNQYTKMIITFSPGTNRCTLLTTEKYDYNYIENDNCSTYSSSSSSSCYTEDSNESDSNNNNNSNESEYNSNNDDNNLNCSNYYYVDLFTDRVSNGSNISYIYDSNIKKNLFIGTFYNFCTLTIGNKSIGSSSNSTDSVKINNVGSSKLGSSLTKYYTFIINEDECKKSYIKFSNEEEKRLLLTNEAPYICKSKNTIKLLGSTYIALYYCAIYQNLLTDVTPTREYFPCIKDDGELKGLYETVEGKFYTSRGILTGPPIERYNIVY